jgi:hypothetical protein
MRIHRLIASAAFAAAISLSGSAFAFETTSIGGTNPDGSAQFQDSTEELTKGSLGGLQFGVTSHGSDSSDDDSTRPPWEIRPPAPSRSYYSSPMGGSMFRPGQ